MNNIVIELDLSRELSEILEQIQGTEAVLGQLYQRRVEILTSLHDGAGEPTKAPAKAPVKRKKASKTESIEESQTTKVPANLEEFSAAIGKPDGAIYTAPMTEESAKAADEAMTLYNEGVEKRSDAQMRMIFALLGNHGITDETEMKQVIWAIVAKQHNGETLESTKDLSKVWATNLIDELNKAKPGELNQYLEVPFP